MGGALSALGVGKSKPIVKHTSFHQFSCPDAEGSEVNFATLNDHVVLVMNVATK